VGGSGARWRVWAARVAVVVAGGVVAVVLTQLWSFAHVDNPAVIEQSAIVRTATSHCAAMRDAAAAAAVGTAASIPQRVGAINAQNDAVVDLVTAMRALGPSVIKADAPTARWVEDWQRLVTVRDAYARSLASGHPRPMRLPTVEGTPLLDRLNEVGISCRVPLALLAP
jgi:hypothetical protein